MGTVCAAPADAIGELVVLLDDLLAAHDVFRCDKPRLARADLRSRIRRVDVLPARRRAHLHDLFPVEPALLNLCCGEVAHREPVAGDHASPTPARIGISLVAVQREVRLGALRRIDRIHVRPAEHRRNGASHLAVVAASEKEHVCIASAVDDLLRKNRLTALL